MSPEGRKSQPIFQPTRQTKLLGDRLLEQDGTVDSKIAGLTEAMVMMLESVDTLTQQGNWASTRIDDLNSKFDNLTNQMEDIWAKKLMRWLIGLSTTILGGLGLIFLGQKLLGK